MRRLHRFTCHMYFKQCFLRHEFRRENFKSHRTLPFCKMHAPRIYFWLNQLSRVNPLPTYCTDTSSPRSQHDKIHHAFPQLCKFGPPGINGKLSYIELLHSVCSTTLERRWQATSVWKIYARRCSKFTLVSLLCNNWCHVRKHIPKQWTAVKNWSTVSQAHLCLLKIYSRHVKMEFSAFLKWDAATWNLPDNKQENNEYFSAKPCLQSRYHSTTSRVSIFFRPLAASLLSLQQNRAQSRPLY